MSLAGILSGVAIRTVKASAVLADRIHRPKRGIVILIYHRVGRRSETRVDLPLWLFEEQMSMVAATHASVGLGQALDHLSAPAGPDSLVITFDDGTADFIDAALPILVRYQVPVTLYIATDFIDTGRAFPHEGKPASWSALRDALTTGLVTIGSHTHSHVLLDRLSARDAARDLDRSVGLIADNLGMKVEHFAYPKAVRPSLAVENEVKTRFQSASLAGTRANPYGATDPYRLARSPIQVDDGIRNFERKLAGGMRLEDDIRMLANRRRLAGLTT